MNQTLSERQEQRKEQKQKEKGCELQAAEVT
jgi:hypothetical protein